MEEEETVKRLQRLANVDEDTEPAFTYRGFKLWSKVIAVGVFLALMVTNVRYSNSAGMAAHFKTVILTLFTVKIWFDIDEYADFGVKAGLIQEEEEQNLEYEKDTEGEE